MATRTPTKPNSPRRDQLLKVSLRLFRERGYHGTGINDIGEAAGVTGPAIYRHFETKDDLLVAAIMEGVSRFRDAAAETLAADLSPEDAVRALCRSFVEVAVADPDLVAVYLLEARHVSPEKLAPLRRRSRSYAREYTKLLLAARPGLSEDEAGTMVTASLFMVASICFVERPLPKARLTELLTDRMAVMLLGPPLT